MQYANGNKTSSSSSVFGVEFISMYWSFCGRNIISFVPGDDITNEKSVEAQFIPH